MDLGTIIVQVTAVIGGIAALIAIFNGIYELREKRQRRAASREPDTQHSPSPPPTLPASPPPTESVPTDTPTQRRSNIGVQITRLIGREAERVEVERLLLRADVRLVTLTGPAGIGKTRLALHVATGLRHHYSAGVFLVALDAVSDPVLVPSKIAQVLDVREQGGQQLLDSLKDYLREKHMLLVLDNFEQVVTASAVVAELLAAAPRLQALVTSREVLRLSGEHVFAVPPLALPDLERVPEGPELVPALTTYEAVRLFVERASAAKAGFALTSDNALAVAGICNRLDGLPLAIELAAARVRLLSPQAILERLVEAPGGSPLHLLTGGARDLPARQQTLRSTIGWSYDLLDQAERDLFERLGVFAGGWTLEAAEAVADGMDVLDGLESLVDKSLVRQREQDGDGRFTMLQTIREYAIERLEATGQAEGVRQAHADFYLRFTEQAEPKLYGATQVEWLKRVETEHDNLRAALRWALDSGQPEVAVRLAADLAWFWSLRGRLSEGRGWLEEALTGSQALGPTETRAAALLGLGDLVSYQGDWATARRSLEESISIFRALGSRRRLARALASLSVFTVRGAQGDGADTQPRAEESLALARELGDPWTLGYVLTVLDIRDLFLGNPGSSGSLGEEALRSFEATGDQWGIALTLRHLGLGGLARGDYEAARVACEKALAASRAMGDRLGQAYMLNYLGDIARVRGDHEQAGAYYDESLALYRELGLKAEIPASLHNLGTLALARGDTSEAKRLQTESLNLHRQAGNQAGMVEALAGLAAVARATGEKVRAARLFGAVEALREAIGGPVWPSERVEYDRQVSALSAELDAPVLASAWAEGVKMTLEQAVAEAVGGRPGGGN